VNILLHIIVGFGISFIGSLPFGMINMTVAHTAIRKGMKPALAMAAGASLVEVFQAFLSLKFTWLFLENTSLEKAFQIIAAVVFFLIGVYFLFIAKSHTPNLEPEPPGRKRHEFLKGMFISSLNLMIIPYWVFYGAVLTANGWLKMENLYVAVFSIGTALGTMFLLFLYSMLGAKILKKSAQITKWVNKFIGLVLLGFAGYEAWQAFVK
jgi:threonine/homoserine/homoserine lactone efflux protein